MAEQKQPPPQKKLLALVSTCILLSKADPCIYNKAKYEGLTMNFEEKIKQGRGQRVSEASCNVKSVFRKSVNKKVMSEYMHEGRE